MNFDDYLRCLVDGLLHAQNASSRGIEAVVEVGDVRLAVNVAVPCGLIVNELITNALRHAFPNARKGEIRVGLKPTNDARIELSVSDNGVGLPAGLDYRTTTSLGLDLVTTLAEQLEARVDVQSNAGTTFRLDFCRGE